MKGEKNFFSSMVNAIDCRVDELQRERKEYEGCIFVSNELLKCQKIIPLAMFGIGVLISFADGYNFLNALTYGGLSGLIGSFPVVLVSSLYFVFSKKHYNKKIKDIDKSITASLEAKQMILEEQEKSVVKKISSSLSDKVISYTESQRNTNDNKKNKIKKLSLKK